MFYELVLEYPDWFSQPAPLEKKSLIEKHIRVMIPECDKEGRPVYIVNIGNVDVDTMELIDVVAVDDIWIESILAKDPELSGKGLSVIVDIANYPWKMIRWMTPENIKLSVKKMQSLPFKDFRIHIVNKSFLIHATIKIIWPFLPSRLKDMVQDLTMSNNMSQNQTEIAPHDKSHPELEKCFEDTFNNQSLEKFTHAVDLQIFEDFGNYSVVGLTS
ncbi:hypothetical protein NQ314_006050 [Rhamnusium bicolor]|uniref:CRAL-TRIO domain-containing protein n=1 Tax=Rhamnusium bicolor TaxID=1586634 RepID=A0AAV8Z9I4_9CUCU|nr:hypothetical protein NQ314_006050 [Rhamnusium bicolor]